MDDVYDRNHLPANNRTERRKPGPYGTLHLGIAQRRAYRERRPLQLLQYRPRDRRHGQLHGASTAGVIAAASDQVTLDLVAGDRLFQPTGGHAAKGGLQLTLYR